MQKPIVNYAFIDLHNLYRSIQMEGWAVDYAKLYLYLREKYGVRKAYIFVGYLPSQRALYRFLEKIGFVLIFKPVVFAQNCVKGNCDAELVLQSMIDFNDYDQAIPVTGDGDFSCLARYLLSKHKFSCVLAPTLKTCSSILRRIAYPNLTFISQVKDQLSYMKSTR